MTNCLSSRLMDRIQSWTEKICGRAVPPVARGNDLADGTLNKANIHKLNGNALKISRHKPASLLSDKMRGRGICSRHLHVCRNGNAVALAWRKFRNLNLV